MDTFHPVHPSPDYLGLTSILGHKWKDPQKDVEASGLLGWGEAVTVQPLTDPLHLSALQFSTFWLALRLFSSGLNQTTVVPGITSNTVVGIITSFYHF